MKTPGGNSPIGDLLRSVLKSHPSFRSNPLGDWSELVGEQVARHSKPVSLKNRSLVVMAYDSVWKHHLEIYKEALIEKINKKRPEPIIDRIVIKVGEVPESDPVLNPVYNKMEKELAKKHRMAKKKKAPLRKLTPEEQELLKSLPDPELRAIGGRLLRRLQAEEKK